STSARRHLARHLKPWASELASGLVSAWVWAAVAEAATDAATTTAAGIEPQFTKLMDVRRPCLRTFLLMVSGQQLSCPGRSAALPAMRRIVRCGALQSRGPCTSELCGAMGPGSAQQRWALQRVRDTRVADISPSVAFRKYCRLIC